MSSSGWVTWLPLVRPHLPQPLAGHSSWRFLERSTPFLPAEGTGVFELHLTSPHEVVDFSVGLTDPTQARALITREPGFNSPILSAWSRNASETRGISALWLELDQTSDPPARALRPGLPAPVVCVKLDGRQDPAWLTEVLIPTLKPHGLDPVQRRTVRECLDAIPKGAQCLYLFDLEARGSPALRLEVFGLSTESMARYLTRIASSDVARQIEPATSLFSTGERLHLAVDVEEREISPRIGVECSFLRQPPREAKWDETLARFQAAGLCTAEQRQAILAWCGVDTFWNAPEAWPRTAIGGHAVRCLSHLKLVTWPDRQLEAKAYLLFRHLRTRKRAREEARSRVASGCRTG